MLAPLRHCPADPRCPERTRGGPCAKHLKKSPASGWSNDTTRVRGRRLQRKRDQLFQNEPLCRECEKQGRIEPATVRDHIVPLAEGGTDDDTNIQPLCQDCSDMKTKAEARRGKARAVVKEHGLHVAFHAEI